MNALAADYVVFRFIGQTKTAGTLPIAGVYCKVASAFPCLARYMRLLYPERPRSARSGVSWMLPRVWEKEVPPAWFDILNTLESREEQRTSK